MKIALSIPGTNGTPMQIDSGLPVPTGGLFTTGQSTIWTFVVLVAVIAILFTLWFVLKGGWDIITSGGHKESIQKGREEILYALLGLLMFFLSIFLLNAANAFLGGNLLPPFFKFK